MQQPCLAFPMTGGHGPTSYANNSSYQRESAHLIETMIGDTIAEKLEIKSSPLSSTPFKIVDLGCSVGPNTFDAVQMIIDAVLRKRAMLGLRSPVPEFQVFFNDHSSNDFNTLLASIPSDRSYFAAAVPGSFHSRLFPTAWIDFFYSSNALHWLSEVPKEVLDKNSPAWNNGRIFYTGGPPEVVDAYSRQFERDFEMFIKARAAEMAHGGMMALLLTSDDEDFPMRLITGFLGSVLMEMVAEGKTEEDKVDTFNVPIFSPNSQQIKKIIKANGCFSIERLEVVRSATDRKEAIDGQKISRHIRTAFEDMIRRHFSNESTFVDELFERFVKMIDENSHLYRSANPTLPGLFIFLKRRLDNHPTA